MHKYFLKGFFLCALVTGTCTILAQTGYRRPAANTNKPAAADTTGKNAANNSSKGIVNQPAITPTTVSNPSGAVSIRYDTTNPGGFDAKPEIALRNNSAVDRNQVKDRKPLEYEHLRDDDNTWSEFLWREIDAREKMNQSFMYPGKDDNGDQRFFSILLNAIKNDSVTAFSADNDRFTTPLTNDQVFNQTSGVYDTVDAADPVTGVIERIITKKPKFSSDSVYTFRIKEQLIFDKEASRLFTRIIGIAPIAKQVIGGKSQPLPDLVIIDGGKGQLSAAMESIKVLDLVGKITVVGLAKNEEEIFFPGDSESFKLLWDSDSLKLVRRIRDEVHRYGISFHRNKRSKGTFKNELISIPGIGEQTIALLLKEFKSVKKIKEKTQDELSSVIGNGRASLLWNHIHRPSEK
jgi:hypothetical protein